MLIFALTIGWAFFTMPSQEEIEQRRAEQAAQDSIAAVLAQQQAPQQEQPEPDPSSQIDTSRAEELAMSQGSEPSLPLGAFSTVNATDTLITTVRTPKYDIELTNLGAGPIRYTLNEHVTWDQESVQMIRNGSRSAYSLGFLSSQNYNIETSNLLFEPLHEPGEILLNGEDSVSIAYDFSLDSNSRIVYTYTFYADQYSFDLQVELENMQPYISGTVVDFGWTEGLNTTEKDSLKDKQSSAAYIFAGGELEKLQLSEEGMEEQRINGTIDWISTRSRFFGQYIKPLTNSSSAFMAGEVTGDYANPGSVHNYQVSVQSNIAQNNVLEYEMFAGPLNYYDLREFDENAYDVIEIGYALIRWFADPLVRFLVIPFFALGSMVISNYGVLIILFGVIVKLLLFPLTQKSFKSMAAMRELQPQLKEIQDKYKDNPEKQQKETIALYRKAKVNPLGGCLPMLLQFPILITLFFFFQNSMIIRQESFLWADDLSAPDYILSLPFSIPLMGDQIAGFVLLMSAAMFLQTKISGGMNSGAAPAGAPNMKAFTYMIPFVLLFVFNNFASGLSLYYLVYNVLSIAQQALINKQTTAPAVAVVDNNTKEQKRKKGKGSKKRK